MRRMSRRRRRRKRRRRERKDGGMRANIDDFRRFLSRPSVGISLYEDHVDGMTKRTARAVHPVYS